MNEVNIIKVMDDTLSNKIAAGEVVERPCFHCQRTCRKFD